MWKDKLPCEFDNDGLLAYYQQLIHFPPVTPYTDEWQKYLNKRREFAEDIQRRGLRPTHCDDCGEEMDADDLGNVWTAPDGRTGFFCQNCYFFLNRELIADDYRTQRAFDEGQG